MISERSSLMGSQAKEPISEEEAYGSFTRREIRALANRIYQEASPLNADLWRAVASAESSLKTETLAKRNSSIGRRLESISIEQLASGQHIRRAGLEELKARGVTTAGRLLGYRPDELAQVTGIGPDSVEKLIRRAQSVSSPRQEDIALSGSIDLWDGADHAVSRALAFWNGIAQLNGSPSARTVRRAALSSSELLRSSAWYRWPFLSRRSRESVRRRLAELDGDVRSSKVADSSTYVGAKLSDLEHHRGVPIDRAYWSNHSAELLTDLERFYLDDDDAEIGQLIARRLGEVDQELIARMNSLRLKTDLLERRLRLYQDLGARFCIAVGSGLLGDDMGLGKTTQALAAIAHITATEPRSRHLVVCPASLLLSWRGEAAMTVPSIVFRMFRGSRRLDELELWLDSGGILAVSYDLSEQLSNQLVARRLTFTCLVADEAHAVKDASTNRSKAVRRLSAVASRTLLMTGTPLVNKATDMISLMRIVDPPLSESLLDRYGSSEDILRDAAEFRSAISGRYLRRKQSDVLAELPPLTLVDVPVFLGRREVQTYKDEVRTGHLGKMRIAASSSPSKLAALREIADEAESAGKKMLIFSEHLAVLDAAASAIGNRSYVVSGGVSEAETSRREAAFRDARGFSALVYQIRKGGVGKNFQEASVVVLCEPQYTPAAEKQAIARAHRMGQTQGVVCYRLIAVGTVDERLVQIVDLKTQLINGLSHESDLEAELRELGDVAVDRGELVRDEQRRLGVADSASQA